MEPGNRIEKYLPENAGKAKEVLILVPGSCREAEDRDSQLILPGQKIGSQVKFRRSEGILRITHIMPVTPESEGGFHPLKADVDRILHKCRILYRCRILPQGLPLFAIARGPLRRKGQPVLGQGKVLDIRGHRIINGGNLSRHQLLFAIPGILGITVLGNSVPFHLNMGRYRDGLPGMAVFLYPKEVLIPRRPVGGEGEIPISI